MGRTRNLSNSHDACLRRSTRKRTMKRSEDYEYFLNEDSITEEQSNSSEIVKIVKKRTPKGYKPSIVSLSEFTNETYHHREETETVPEPVAFEEVEAESIGCSETDGSLSLSFESSYSDMMSDYNPKVIVSTQRRKAMLSNIVRLQTTDLARMEEKDIINIHCNNLIRRLECVAYSYLDTWTIPCPVFCPPNVFLGGNPDKYSSIESDETAVNKVVENMLNAVSSLH
uniref:ORF3 n=1 Tax=Caenorhabditis tropicalis TaxID=1561998 RepID=A0A1I7T5E2_9PELO